MAEPIQAPAGGAALLQQLLGQQTTTSGQTLAQQLQNVLTNGSTTGTTGGSSTATTTNTAELGPLIQAFAQASGGMDPAQLTALISSIFTEGAAQVPALTQQYANSTGSRVSGNSGLNLALGDLNRQMSTQAVQALLGYNQSSQATAGNIASNIANATRSTQQQGSQQQQTAGTTQQSQQQTGTTSNNSTQTQRQGVNPLQTALVGAGGTALNWLDKKGAFDNLFGNKTPGVGTVGTGILPSSGSAPMSLTNGGGGMLSTPSASQGFLQGPTSANPYGYSGGGVGAGGGTSVPDFSGGFANNGITNFGGFGSTSDGLLGTAANAGFGALPAGTDVFGTAGSDSLGSGLNFGNNPYDYGGSAGGITGIVNGGGSGGSGGSGFFGDLGNSLGNALGGVSDWIGSFFANGGMIGPQQRMGYADGGQVETGAMPTRARNVNFLGSRMDGRDRTGALNYEGYAASPSAAGASVPAGGSPSLGGVSSAITAATPATPGSGALTTGDPQQQALAQFREAVARGQAASDAFARNLNGGGSGGVGEGAAPGQNEGDNGAAGIGPSGIAAAPPGTPNAVSGLAGLMGMPAPGLSAVLGMIAAIASAVNAGNQASATNNGSSPTNTSADALGLDPSTVAEGSGGGNAGVGGDSGTASGGSTGGSSSGEGGNGGGNYADGGLVRGPGTGTSDSIKVKPRQAGGKQISYSDGEYVIPKDVVDALGVQHFDTLLDAFHTNVSV